ncbi:ABC transporter ATP-binding protein [Malikia sp.]|uniref:ABC transporter ATP-binding protein n=1 Tax=Malikia sp. TaxID=2070706 RepID=UPI0026189511|nr:ABC transporter ATP-binding protein [Malikia sp.]MDD2728019.1 ABC transporter ATP-binding protein [Malikia sp.]
MTEPNPLLELRDLNAWYGKSHVLHGVDLCVGAGEIVALLGRNGSGRSTTARAVMGLVDCAGEIRWRGRSILGRPTFEIARAGLGYVPEDRAIFPGLTVEQNLALGRQRGKSGRWQLDDMYRLFPQLKARRQTEAGHLSGGEQQMLTLCRTLMGEPQLVIVDEPTEGLAPQLVEQLGDFLCQLRREGVAVLLIEQKLAIALAVSQRALVMGHGRVVFDGTPAQLLASPELRREWLEV